MSEQPTAAPVPAPFAVPAPGPGAVATSPEAGAARRPGLVSRLGSLRTLVAVAITTVALSGVAGGGLAAAANGTTGDQLGRPGGGPGGRFAPPGQVNGQTNGQAQGQAPPITGTIGSGAGT